MRQAKKSEKVSKKMQATFDAIVAQTDQFSAEYLNEEYAEQARYVTAALCRKKPSPLTSGRTSSWACGVIYALGFVNFLFDQTEEPHISATELCNGFGVSKGTGYSKSKVVKDALGMERADPEWYLPSNTYESSMMKMSNLMSVFDSLSEIAKELQERPSAAGALPNILGALQGHELAGTKARTKKKTKRRHVTPALGKALYVMEVVLMSGPVTQEFADENPEVSRTIEIRGNQTLASFHEVLFKAFDRFEEHLYEFQVGGQGPNDPNADRYVLPVELEPLFGSSEPAGEVSKTKIASLDLSVGDMFGYWFDFGDDWWHQIRVVEILDIAPKRKYPRITKRVGESPEQYPIYKQPNLGDPIETNEP